VPARVPRLVKFLDGGRKAGAEVIEDPHGSRVYRQFGATA
jgi:hypothetical protein